MALDYKKQLGLDLETGENYLAPEVELVEIIEGRLQMISGQPQPTCAPIDERIQAYLDSVLGAQTSQLPATTFVLDRFGLSRMLSLSPKRDEYLSDIVSSYRLRQGVLHNPKNDKRTTKGVFHIAEGGLPIPADKEAVPLQTFAALLKHALNPTQELLQLPYTADAPQKVGCWVSLYLRPLISPRVERVTKAQSMECRLLVPGNLVSNLDFVESVFGNAGCPRQNDAALDVEHWSGHTGCIILAPHIVGIKKIDLGLPHYDQATPRQRRDGMCYRDASEKYNEGRSFKITSRDERGIIVTIIADNYYGYCKKEIKTQIGYAANLYGLSEEEHAGGALTFAAYDLGEDFALEDVVHAQKTTQTYDDALKLLGDRAIPQPEGYAIDKHYPNILYVPQNVRLQLHDLSVRWSDNKGLAHRIHLMANTTYVLPSGYKIQMTKPEGQARWRLVGTVAEPCMCHKPATVSGGGKSEISKPIADACITGSVFVLDFQADMDQVEMLLNFDYTNIYADPAKRTSKSLPILSLERSLGSVVNLFTISSEYTDGYNDFLRSIPTHVIEILLIVKRYYKKDWGDKWRERFSVDLINGTPGHELKYHNQRLTATFLRVGYERDGSWRTLGVRKDFYPATKIQMEDDITASIVLPARLVKGLGAADSGESIKFVDNCEYRLFQRPDDAIIRGYDKQTERDMAMPGHFLSNYEPLNKAQTKAIVDDAIRFDHFTQPMQQLLRDHASDPKGPAYVGCPAYPRIVAGGEASKNTRYLQNRPDLLDPRGKYLAEIGLRLSRRLNASDPIYTPVNIVVPGRRNNPPEKGSKALCVFSPLHYLELPELFMEFISSMTGKSPSTVGAGSEGALTKGAFNALLPIIDLNAAFVSALLTNSPTFLSSASYVGPYYKVNHDISLLIPEVFSRMSPEERKPEYLIKNGYLERVRDFPWEGEHILASRLGWRITALFEKVFFGRVFNSPGLVLPSEMLRPELQDKQIFVDSVKTITDTHKITAMLYFEDGSIDLAVPPLRALLHIMAYGTYEGLCSDDEAFRSLFRRESMMASDWYAERLQAKQRLEVAHWQARLAHLQAQSPTPELATKIAYSQERLARALSPEYISFLRGTLGAAPRLR